MCFFHCSRIRNVSVLSLSRNSLCLLSFSYAEVRAERRRAFGLEELSPPEIAPSSVKVRVKSPVTCSM